MDDEYVIDPLDKTIHSTVHSYKNPHTGKRGAIGLSPVVGMNASTVQNKANPREEFSGFFPKEIRKVMLNTNNFDFLHQLNQDCGFVAVEVPYIECPADMDLLGAHIELVGELGEATSAMKEALQDKKLTIKELNVVEREFYDVVQKVYSLVKVLRGMAEPEDNVTQISKAKS